MSDKTIIQVICALGVFILLIFMDILFRMPAPVYYFLASYYIALVLRFLNVFSIKQPWITVLVYVLLMVSYAVHFSYESVVSRQIFLILGAFLGTLQGLSNLKKSRAVEATSTQTNR